MLNKIVEPAVVNLKQAEILFTDLSPDVYSNTTAGPYYSSIGGHLRHIFDVFQCVLDGIDSKNVDLTNRMRGTIAESDPVEGLKYMNKIISGLESLSDINPEVEIVINDDLGLGMVDVKTTLGGGLCQAHSHAIHHFACIGYLLHIHGADLPNEVFGYNPTTPTTSTSDSEL